MSKTRPSRKAMLIALCAIPAVALAGAALSMPVPSHILSEISGYSLREELLSEEKDKSNGSRWLKIQNRARADKTEN